MAGARKLVIEILGDAKDASKAFGDVRKDSDKTRERLDNFGTAALGVGVAIAGGLAFAVKEFAEADKQSQKLDNSIRNSEQTFRRNGQALRDLAQATQNKTAADADGILAGQAVLVQMGLTERQIIDLTPLIVDLSRKMGIDMESAGKAVAKSVDGSSTALRKMGINVDAAKMAADPFAATMEALRGTVGGFAEEEGKTAAGQLERLKNQFGDLVEAVGGGAADLFLPVVDALGRFTTEAGPAGQAVGDFAGKAAGIGAVALFAVGGLVKIKGAFDSARTSFTTSTGELNNFGRAARGLGFVSIGIAVYGIAQSINEATKNTLGFQTALDNLAAAKTAEAQAAAFEKAYEASQGFFDRLLDVSRVQIPGLDTLLGSREQFDMLSVSVNGTQHNLQRVSDTLAYLEQSGDTQALANALTLLKGNATGSRDSMDALRGILKPYEDAQGAANRRAKDGADKQRDLGAATGETTTKIEEQAAELRAQTDPVFAAMRAIDQETQAQNRARDAVARVTALRAAGETGTAEYAQAVRDASAASLDSVSASVGLDGALSTLIGKVQSGEVSVDRFDQILGEYVKTGRVSADTAGIMALRVAGVRDRLREVPPTTAATVTVRTGNSGDLLDTLNAKIRGLRTTLSTIGVLSPQGRQRLEQELYASLRDANRPSVRRSVGGPVLAGLPYLVGERGPEMFVPTGSGYVVPNRQLASATATPATGATSLVVNVTAGVGDPVAIGRQVAETLRAYERTGGRGPWRD